MKRILFAFGLVFLLARGALAAETSTPTVAPRTVRPQPTASPELEFNSILFENTFKIYGPTNKKNVGSCGTVFLVLRPLKSDPTKGRWVLVMAGHVLDGIAGDSAFMAMRSYQNNSWNRVPIPLQIRQAGKPLWAKHPTADVAAMYVSIPSGLEPQHTFSSTTLLGNDEKFIAYGLHPGDQLFALGFPFCEEGNFGFPVLRGGTLASYPLVPSSTVHSFLLDFSVFPGNSGGPIYTPGGTRIRGNAISAGAPPMVVGLVSAQALEPDVPNPSSSSTGALFTAAPPNQKRGSLSLAIVVPASFISDTIEALPPPD